MSGTINQELINSQFPTLKDMTYLNNASTGIPPKSTIDAMKEYLDNKIRAIGSFQETLALLKSTREHLANLLGGHYKQYGFVPNTSEGINAFGHGISYPEGSNIVICDLEFPANYVPWQNISKLYDVELRVVKSVNGAVPIERFAEKIDKHTRVVSVSQVQFASGYRIDLSGLAKIVHESNAFLVSDIIQAAGCVDTDLVLSDVDFAAAQSAKWLIGPIGSGFVYIKEEILEQVKPRYLGWWGVKNLWEFHYHERELMPDATRFIVGSPAMAAYVGFHESLRVLLSIPGETREHAAISIADYLRKRLEEESIPFYDFPEKNRSAIVSCAPHGADDLQKDLHKDGIHCSVRNGRLRVSPHFYNSFDDIDRLIEKLETGGD
ncbi:MAG: aminotransferase class V-fold PLP-dependent enzyme [Candidatus Lokiarchaeota archaeon]|nr:aminotransferase class V-fold PLP-dependent enzyme [Candidatus Lokiarchaeota archaeon]